MRDGCVYIGSAASAGLNALSRLLKDRILACTHGEIRSVNIFQVPLRAIHTFALSFPSDKCHSEVVLLKHSHSFC